MRMEYGWDSNDETNWTAWVGRTGSMGRSVTRHHIPSAKPKDIVRALLHLGFIERKGKGSHRFFRHPESKAITVVPIHSQELSPEFLKEIIKQAGVSVEEFLNLL